MFIRLISTANFPPYVLERLNFGLVDHPISTIFFLNPPQHFFMTPQTKIYWNLSKQDFLLTQPSPHPKFTL